MHNLVAGIIGHLIMKKLNIVQGLYIVLRPNTNSREIPGFQSQDTTPDPPCIIIIYIEYT